MPSKRTRIAITGGIGSGKTTVSDILREAGYYVVSCDEVYSELLKGELKDSIAMRFGEVLNEDGSLNREKLAKRVFGDKLAVERLNQLTHPLIMRKGLKHMRGEYSFMEVPLLFEGGYEKLFDKVIVVRRDLGERIDAVMERSGLSEDEIVDRMSAQVDYDHMDYDGLYVLMNDGDMKKLRMDTLALVAQIKAEVQKKANKNC